MEQFKDYMQLYLFNRERFEKIGASDYIVHYQI